MAAPVFKKKRRRGGTRVSLQALESDAPEDQAAPDEETSVADILTLRQLKRGGMGIDLQRLNEGERERERERGSKKRKTGEKSKEVLWEEQLARGGLVSSSLLAPAAESEEGQRRKILTKDNFQTETGAVDVDKYMLAYIEEEMKKRHAPPLEREEVQKAILDPNDELSKIAEQYRHLQKEKQEKEEGSVTLSAGMLGSVPEWDLGIEAKIRNIEQTEWAKRELQKRSAESKDEVPLPNARFATRSGVASESEFRAQAAESPSEIEENFRFNTSYAKLNERHDQRTKATDNLVADRFRKRHAENFAKKK